MRPSNVTDADIQEWEEDRQNFHANEDRHQGFFPLVEIPPDIWYTGCWLARELESLGCDVRLASDICEATGQRQAGSNDCWQTAIDAVKNYKNGIWDKPGEDLARQIITEKYGNSPDPKKILSDLIAKGVDPEKLFAMALRKLHCVHNEIE